MADDKPDGCLNPSDNATTTIDRRQILRGLTTSAVGIGGLSGSSILPAAGTTTQSSSPTISPTLIEANEENGFNFPYVLYAPKNVREKPLVVETVNSGGCNDDFQVDLDAAQRTAEYGPVRQISDSLQVPMIVPVFANPCEGEFFERFVQTLDTQTMRVDEGKFERIDLQLIQMIEDARSRLADKGHNHPTEVMLNGFSASGNFMNKFAILHPERVASVTAGAINGMAILPRESVDGQQTNYMIGVADLENLIGEEFNREAWQKVPQFCYMGETESPPQDDTLPYRDVWSKKQAAIARDIYGDNMQTDRMTFSEYEYHKAGASARFEVYDGIGHTYNREIIEEVIEFHRRNNNIPADDIEEPGQASFVTEPQAGDTSVEVSYKWPSDASEQQAYLSVVPDGDSKYWQRRIFLDALSQGEEKTSTFNLNTSKEGVPFESGDEVKLWLIPEGNQTPRRATAIQKVTISGDGTLSASSCDEDLEHPDIEISFADRPTAEDQEVAVSYDIGDGFGQRARTRLFPESGGGKYGLGLDRIDAGNSGQKTYSISTNLKLGETAELRVFPVGWDYLEDVVATTCTVVSGVQFPDMPSVGSSSVTVEYLHPEGISSDAVLELTIDSETVDEVSGISPGTFEAHTFSLTGFDTGVPGETEVETSLRPVGSTESIDSVTYQTRSADAGAVSFAEQPSDGDQSVTLQYALNSDTDVGRFAALRLYHEEGSSWGIYLNDVATGETGLGSFDIASDKPGVPLSEGTELTVALVSGDDPYRSSPIGTATSTVGADMPNSPPTADAGPDKTVSEEEAIILDASRSSDPDGDTLTYSWTQTGGPGVTLSDADTATPEFTAPTVDEETDLTFEVTVDDGGATDTDTVTATVTPSSDPTIDDYANENDIVDINGFTDALDDLIEAKIGVPLFTDVLDAFIAGEPVT